jgi:hypothetical protein
MWGLWLSVWAWETAKKPWFIKFQLAKNIPTIAVEGTIFVFGFSKKYDLSPLSNEDRVLDRCRAFDRIYSVDAHLWPQEVSANLAHVEPEDLTTAAAAAFLLLFSNCAT